VEVKVRSVQEALKISGSGSIMSTNEQTKEPLKERLVVDQLMAIDDLMSR